MNPVLKQTFLSLDGRKLNQNKSRYEQISNRSRDRMYPEEDKLIDSLKRLAKKWDKDGKRLWLYSASGSLHVMMHGDTDYNPTPEFMQYGGSNIENSVTTIDGILNDGGDW